MRVLYFSRSYTNHDYRFLNDLSGTGRDLSFLRLDDDAASLETRPLPTGVAPIRWPVARREPTCPSECLARMEDFEAILSECKPDLIHAGPVQTCGFMTALSGARPFLLMSWGSDILADADRGEDWRWATRFALRHADRFICDCDAVRNKARRYADLDDSKVIQFPWGVDLDQFAPRRDSSSLRKSFGWDDAFILLCARSWEPIYGMLTCLEAFRIAHRENPSLRLLLVGSGSLAGEIERKIEANGLSEAILRAGRIQNDRLPDYLRAADATLSCALSDGSSISLLEAMATGLPVIATDNESNREWVTPGVNGWLASAEDASGFAQAISTAAALSPEKRSEIAAANRSLCEKRANWKANIRRLKEIYETYETKEIRMANGY